MKNKIFHEIPNHLCLARNSNAPEEDRFRLYSPQSNTYLADTGAPTAEECIAKWVELREKTRKEWVN